MGNLLCALICFKLKEEEEHLKECDCVRVDAVSVDSSTHSSMPGLIDPSSDSTDDRQEGEL